MTSVQMEALKVAVAAATDTMKTAATLLAQLRKDETDPAVDAVIADLVSGKDALAIAVSPDATTKP